jgi:hypothetical protein
VRRPVVQPEKRALAGRNAFLDGWQVLAKLTGYMGPSSNHPRTEVIRRILALGCVALVFALGVFAASPVLHEQLHAGSQAVADDGCAVALFAGGVSLVVPVVALPPSSEQWAELPGSVSRELFLESPRYLLQPERGPPVV